MPDPPCRTLIRYMRSRAFLGCLVVLVTAPTSAAQDVDPRADAPIQIGPFYITPVLELTRLGVDTNVFNTRGEQQSDFTFTGGPKIDIAVPLRRVVVTAETVTDFVYYRQYANQRGVNFDMTLRGEVQLPRLSFFVEDSFLDTRERPNLEIDVRARRKENDVRAGVNIGFFRKLEVELSASQSLREYAGDDFVGASLARRLNRDAVAASGSVRYAVTPLTTISVTGEMREERFTLTSTRDHDSWSLVPSVKFDSRALVSGSAEVGYRSLHGHDASLPDFRGPVAVADLSYKLLGSTTLGFTASRDVEFSLEVTEPYYVATGYGVSLRHQLAAPFGISVGTQRFNLGYQRFESGVTRPVSADRVDTIRSYSVTIHRRLTRSTELGFDVSHRSRRSNSPALLGRDYDGLMFGITMTFAL